MAVQGDFAVHTPQSVQVFFLNRMRNSPICSNQWVNNPMGQTK